MKFNFRKITSVLVSAVMLGSTAGLALAATNYPAPFIQSGRADVAVVVGSTAAGSDYLASVDLGQNLQVELAKQTATTTGGTGASATGGDSVNLATSSRKIYYGDSINAALPSLSSTNLPTVLADGTFKDIYGNSYPYTQTILPGATVSTFGTSGGDLKDPVLYLDAGTTPSTAPLYNYTLSFTKNLNVTDSTGVQGRSIKILGVDYVIGSGSTNTTLYLQGAGETVKVTGGESKTVTIGGLEHTVELVTTSSSTQATISVDGVSLDVAKGGKYTFAGSVVVYVKSIVHPAFAGDLRQAELLVGATALRMDNGGTVKIGSDETSIKGTSATITAAGAGLISGFTVSIAMAKSQVDHIAAGESFKDPVFGGLKVQFGGVVPTLDDTSRGKITLSTDNNQYGFVAFTKYGTTEEKKLTYVYDNNTVSTAIQPLLAHQTITANNRGHIHVLEGANAKLNDWIVINQGDSGTILEVTDLSQDTATSGSVTLEDAILCSGVTSCPNSQKVTLTNASGPYVKSNVNFFGGSGYTISMSGDGTTVNITWNAAGARAIFPRIKLKDGGWISLLTEVTVPNTTLVIFPNGQTSLSTSTTNLSMGADQVAASGINWTISNAGSNPVVYGIANPSCNFNSTKGPAVLFLEPKKWDDSSFGNFICTPLTTAGTLEIAIGDPVFNGTNSAYTTFSTDTFKKQAVDKYGTLVTKEDRTNENGIATISYPMSQMYLDVLFTSEGAVVTPGGGGGGNVVELGSVTVKDSEVSTVSEKNLIVVGGSCVNTVAAKLLGSTTPLCGAAFTDKTGISNDQWLIKSFDNPYSTGKIAMLVAGYEAADTTKAVKELTTTSPATDVGTIIAKGTVTGADVTTVK